MTVERLVLDELAPMPWRNGLGRTREVLSWPPGAGFDAFLWRVSVASITVDGPFSAFPGVDRTIILLEGEGIHLRGDRVDQRIDRPYHPFAFSGDAPLSCELLGTDSTNFNVMSRRGQARADIAVLTGPATITGEHGLIVGLRGECQLAQTRCPAGSGVSWAASSRSWQLNPNSDDALVIAVTFQLVW